MKSLIVDDHALIRDALRAVVAELAGDAHVVEAVGAHAARACMAEHGDIDLVLLDLYLPDGSGFDLLAEFRDGFPSTSVVVLSASIDKGDITHALDLGALGFIPKSASRAVMLSALKLVFSGGVYVPPEIFGASRAAAPPPGGPSTPPSARDLGLTARQFDVLLLMMQGKSNKAICRDLDLAEPTVKNHVTAILRVLGASNRTEAVIAASALGLGTGERSR